MEPLTIVTDMKFSLWGMPLLQRSFTAPFDMLGPADTTMRTGLWAPQVTEISSLGDSIEMGIRWEAGPNVGFYTAVYKWYAPAPKRRCRGRGA